MENIFGSCGDTEVKIKAVILIGGPDKGTRFRPLSLELPKPLFPIAGYSIIYHHIEACCSVPGLKEVILIGFYHYTDELQQFIENAQHDFKIQIRYLQEFVSLGTAGGIYHFRDQILGGSPNYFFVMNADVCCDFPLNDMLDFHREIGEREHFTLLTTEAAPSQTSEFGCIVHNPDTHEVVHYVEKPKSFVSTTVNCGVYLFSPSIFKFIRVAFLKHQEENFKTIAHPVVGNFDFKQSTKESIHLEREVIQPLAGCGKLYVFNTKVFWSQIKTPGAAIYANRHKLINYKGSHPQRLAQNGEGKPIIIGEVYIHPSAVVDPTAKLGPNVSIGKHVTIARGVRLRECIVLPGCVLRAHCCLINAVLGWSATVGEWARVEGTLNDPNPDKPFAKLEVVPMFNAQGQLNPSITIIGSRVEIPAEIVIRNSVVLPHKQITDSLFNQIML